jgi:hypothetical protein
MLIAPDIKFDICALASIAIRKDATKREVNLSRYVRADTDIEFALAS